MHPSRSTEPESLEKQVGRAEQEARMVLPGIQALFGFQLIAVFNAGFFDRLSPSARTEHFVALIAVALSTLLIMTPAAFHRQAEQGVATRRFVLIASRFTCAAMFLLAVGIALETDLIGSLVLASTRTAHFLAAILLVLYLAAWFAFPRLARRAESEIRYD